MARAQKAKTQPTNDKSNTITTVCKEDEADYADYLRTERRRRLGLGLG